MELIDLLLYIAFPLIAWIYSSVGFGGGSSYIALLALTKLLPEQIRFYALICNIIVVSINLYFYIYRSELNFKKSIQLTLISVPFAFLGGSFSLNQETYTFILALVLGLASIIMLSQTFNKLETFKLPKSNNYILSGAIGFISGLVGIGGGIFLAPYLYLSKWANPKSIAATCSFFILVNSIAGLSAILIQRSTIEPQNNLFLFIALVSLGSLLGKLKPLKKNRQLKLLTSLLILLVSIKLLST